MMMMVMMMMMMAMMMMVVMLMLMMMVDDIIIIINGDHTIINVGYINRSKSGGTTNRSVTTRVIQRSRGSRINHINTRLNRPCHPHRLMGGAHVFNNVHCKFMSAVRTQGERSEPHDAQRARLDCNSHNLLKNLHTRYANIYT